MRNPASLLRSAVVLAGLLTAALFVALPSAARADVVLLNVGTNGTGTGTVTSNAPPINCGTVCLAFVERNTPVNLLATPAPGSRLAGWGGACAGVTATTCPLFMYMPLTVTATFNQTRRLTIVSAGSGIGRVSSTPSGISCGGPFLRCAEDFDLDSMVTLAAAPENGLSRFVGWSGGGCSGTGTCQVTMDAAKTVTATFSGSYRLVVTNGGFVQNAIGRTVSSPAGLDCTTGNCDAVFPEGTVVTLTMTPGARAVVESACGTFTATATCQVTMDADKRFSIKYIEARTLTFARAGTGEGTIVGPGIDCGLLCSRLLELRTSVTATTPGGICLAGLCYEARPAPGSVFAGWSGNLCPSPFQTYCQGELNDDFILTATFSRPHVLTVAKTGAGAGTIASTPAGIDCGPTCSAPFDQGTAVTLTATPAAGSVFGGWSGGGCSGTGTCTVTVNSATSVTASFAAVVTLTVRKPWSGTGNVTSVPAGIDCGAVCTATYPKGTTVVLTGSPAGASRYWGHGIENSHCPEQYRFPPIPFTCTLTLDTSTTVETYFAVPRTLSIVKAGTGASLGLVVSAQTVLDCGDVCSGEFPDGDVLELIALPGPDAEFVGWSGACTGQQARCGVVLDANVSATATFDAHAAPPTPPTPPTPTDPTPPTPVTPTPVTPTPITPVPVTPDPGAAGTPTPVRPVVIDTRLVKVALNRAKKSATFTFAAVRGPKRFQCALAKFGKTAKLAPCTSPKTYRNLKPGRHTFRVRTVGDTTPVVRTITVLAPRT